MSMKLDDVIDELAYMIAWRQFRPPSGLDVRAHVLTEALCEALTQLARADMPTTPLSDAERDAIAARINPVIEAKMQKIWRSA